LVKRITRCFPISAIDFDIGIELLVKMIKPDASNTVYADGIVVCEEEVYITDVERQEIFRR